MVTAAHVLPGRPDIVHHVILYEMTGGRSGGARHGQGNWREGLDVLRRAGVGEDSIDHGRWLGVWVPGKTNDAFPAGTGMSFPKGAAIVVQVHYNLSHRLGPIGHACRSSSRPPGAKVKALETKQFFAPIEVPCPAGAKGPLCNRDGRDRELRRHTGSRQRRRPMACSLFCGKTLPSAAGSTTTCDRIAEPRRTRLRLDGPSRGTAHSSSGLGRRPLTAVARVRIPYGP